jgi:hypothetical protein
LLDSVDGGKRGRGGAIQFLFAQPGNGHFHEGAQQRLAAADLIV